MFSIRILSLLRRVVKRQGVGPVVPEGERDHESPLLSIGGGRCRLFGVLSCATIVVKGFAFRGVPGLGNLEKAECRGPSRAVTSAVPAEDFPQ